MALVISCVKYFIYFILSSYTSPFSLMCTYNSRSLCANDCRIPAEKPAASKDNELTRGVMLITRALVSDRKRPSSFVRRNVDTFRGKLG